MDCSGCGDVSSLTSKTSFAVCSNAACCNTSCLQSVRKALENTSGDVHMHLGSEAEHAQVLQEGGEEDVQPPPAQRQRTMRPTQQSFVLDDPAAINNSIEIAAPPGRAAAGVSAPAVVIAAPVPTPEPATVSAAGVVTNSMGATHTSRGTVHGASQTTAAVLGALGAAPQAPTSVAGTLEAGGSTSTAAAISHLQAPSNLAAAGEW